MGFTEEEQDNIMTVTCACLHFANVDVISLTDDESKLNSDNEHLDYVLNLIGSKFDDLNRALCYFSIQAGRETHVRSRNKNKTEQAILSLVKATYGAMFDFIVKRVNSSITVPTAKAGHRQDKVAAFIGCLDIFGFESFKHNSFEQLCINYCNEALQRQFNLFVLKSEQEEYTREGIKWSFIEFPENQDVLDLIDKKPSGIIQLLDDASRGVRGSDKTFADALYRKCSGHKRFEATFRQKGAMKFGVKHYAGPVEYECEGFVEKNKDQLPNEAVDLLLTCSNDFVKELGKILKGDDDSAAKPASPAGRRRHVPSRSKKTKSVGSKFSSQLNSLLNKITVTSPHYVRCIKANDQLIPDHFDPVTILDQLRCAGVIEAVRVSRLGYPQRYSHAMFLSRYSILAAKELKKASKGRKKRPVDVLVNTIAKHIMELENSEKKKANTSKDKNDQIDLVAVGLQVGKTKVFLRQKAFDSIERLRKYQMEGAAKFLQKVVRRYIAMHDYQTIRVGMIALQSICRRNIAMDYTQELREQLAATRIQTYYRRYHARKIYLATCYVAISLQRIYRGRKGRERYLALNQIRKSIIIQKYWRSYYCYTEFQKLKSSIIIEKYWRSYICYKKYHTQKKSAEILQRAVRCYFARKELKTRKAAAKDLKHLVVEKDRLQQENLKLMKLLTEANSKAAKAAWRAATVTSSLTSVDLDELGRLRIEKV